MLPLLKLQFVRYGKKIFLKYSKKELTWTTDCEDNSVDIMSKICMYFSEVGMLTT